jgi:hypothetical protein
MQAICRGWLVPVQNAGRGVRNMGRKPCSTLCVRRFAFGVRLGDV